MVMAGLNFNGNHFELFGLSPQYALDTDRLDKQYREIQAKVHPDRFTQSSDIERRMSLQWATRVNEAYQTLRAPLKRAQYLLELQGTDIQLENNGAMSPDFLVEQMEWREAVEEARQGREYGELEEIHLRVRQTMKRHYQQLSEQLDGSGDSSVAADVLRRLMFLEKLLSEVDEALAAIEDN